MDTLQKDDHEVISSVGKKPGSDSGLRTLLEGHSPSPYKKGDLIFKNHDNPDFIYYLDEGRVKVGTHTKAGREVIKAVIYPGEIFAEGRLFEAIEPGDFAQAILTSKVYAIPLAEARRKITADSVCARSMLQTIGLKFNAMNRRLESLVFRDARSRIVDFLKEMGKTRGEQIGYEIAVRNFAMTHQDMANLTGTSRQTVTMVLNELKDSNLIYIDRRTLLIRDYENLT